MKLTSVIKAGLLVAGASWVDAFWRMPCHGRTGLARIDPLVSYGKTAEHEHVIHGGSAFSTTATTEDLLKSECTSCAVEQDKSAYWTPALYFKEKATGDFKLVDQVGGMLAYYLLNPVGVDLPIRGFPAGFEMIAGDTYQRNFTWPVPDKDLSSWTGDLQSQAFLQQYALGFNCLNYAITPEGSLTRHFMPDKQYLDEHCTDGIRLELFFPSCWDGKNLDGVNHDKHSHMAYPNLGQTGTCPDGFPVRTVRLFFETIWNTYAFKGTDGEFVLANGDPTGYGYHGDFVMGWEESFLDKAVQTCTDRSGTIEACPLFDIKDGAEYNAPTCTLENDGGLVGAAFKEVSSDSKALPGDVQVKAGPAYAKGAAVAKPSSSSVTVPTITHPEGTKIGAPTYAPEPAAGTYVAPKPDVVQVANVEPAPAVSSITTPPPAPTQGTESFFSTQYTTKGREVHEVFWVEELVTITASETTTSTLRPQRKRHVHKHRRHEKL